MNNWKEYHQVDTKISYEVFDLVHLHYLESLKTYPESINLMGAFFVDFFRSLSGTILRNREMKNGIVLSDPLLWGPTPQWPHVSYHEIKNGLPNSFKSPKAILHALPFSKRVFSFLSRIWALSNPKRKTILFSSEFSEKDLLLKLFWSRNEILFIDPKKHSFCIPHLADQLEWFRKVIVAVHQKFEFPFEIQSFFEMFKAHILNSVLDGEGTKLPLADYLVVWTNGKLSNRLIAMKAKGQMIPVIGFQHGDSFGALDSHVFGIFEQPYADWVVGYGTGYSQHSQSYQKLLFSPHCLIPSSSDLVVDLLKTDSISRSYDLSRAYYFPTSLRGSWKRYGLHQEWTDLHYLDWQKKLLNYWGDELKIKGHPKDEFFSVTERYLGHPLLLENLKDMVDEVSVFVFDYVSTAFALAAATNRPIIYFDLGIQNIHPEALSCIQERCVYVDVIKNGFPSREDLLKQIDMGDKNHRFSEMYSVDPNSNDRYSSTVQFISERD